VKSFNIGSQLPSPPGKTASSSGADVEPDASERSGEEDPLLSDPSEKDRFALENTQNPASPGARSAPVSGNMRLYNDPKSLVKVVHETLLRDGGRMSASELTIDERSETAGPVSRSGSFPSIPSHPVSLGGVPSLGAYAKRFRIIRSLGSGGMGEVFEAYDAELKTHVALKVLREWTPSSIRSFKEEFRTVSSIQHPNLVRLHNFYKDEQCCFFTMDLVEGQDFLSFVRAYARAEADSPTLALEEAISLPPTESRRFPGSFDLERLRSALVKLVQGLQVLHAAGTVHRDIKPSNVMIDAEGKLVILDFGLAKNIESRFLEEGLEESHQIMGTAFYMAPEQAAGRLVGPPADFYSLGAVLYHALTGRPPHDGSLLEILLKKQTEKPAKPSELVLGVPADLEELCMDLLCAEPSERPKGEEILRRLGQEVAPIPRRSLSVQPISLGKSSPFIGRDAEMRILQDAHDSVRAGKPVVVVICGESGVGKTMLMRRFAETHPEDLIFGGRCHEKEHIPFKAFDGIMEAVSSRLKRMSEVEVAKLLPLHADLIVQAFPVMRKVPLMAQVVYRNHDVDPQELLKRLFGALREFFIRFSARNPIVLLIDDLQWADPDSKALLDSLLHPPEAPNLLIVATHRDKQPQGIDFPSEVRLLDLPQLSEKDARELAGRLLANVGAEATPEKITAIVDDAGGHPLFIAELIRRSSLRKDRPGEQLSLDGILREGARELPLATQQLLALICVAGRPLPLEVIKRSSGMVAATFEQHLSTLSVGQFIRIEGSRRTDKVWPYHDRIRESIAGGLSVDQRRILARHLAKALQEAEHQNPEALVEQWRAAGSPRRAAYFADLAGQDAMKGFAYGRAAFFYALALQLDPPRDPKKRSALLQRLGDALSNAGQGKEAADAYLAAKEGSSDGSELQRLAAGQLLRSGYMGEGTAAMGQSMDEANLLFLRKPASLIPAFLGVRTWLFARGQDFKKRPKSAISPAALRRVDICLDAAMCFSMAETFSGAYYASKAFLEALKIGEIDRIAMTMALEAVYVASTGIANRTRAYKLVKRSQEIAQESEKPEALFWSQLSEFAFLVLMGDFNAATARTADLEKLIQRCQNAFWEKSALEIWTIWSLAHTGKFRELQQRVPRALHEAGMRGDRFAITNLNMGLPSFFRLVADDPETALRESDENHERWLRNSVQMQDYYWVLGKASALLYLDQSPYGLIESHWMAFKRAQLFRTQLARLEALHLRARAALVEGLDDLAIKHVRRALGEDVPWSNPVAHLILAGVLTKQGKQEESVRLLAQAREESLANPANQMEHYAMVADWQRGRLIGGDEGRALILAAEAWAAKEGVRNWPALAAMYAPGFPR
jgi:eukaryotic-like serine/threonine-protein kinase